MQVVEIALMNFTSLNFFASPLICWFIKAQSGILQRPATETRKEKTRDNLKSKLLQKKGQKYQIGKFLEREKHQKQLLLSSIPAFKGDQYHWGF